MFVMGRHRRHRARSCATSSGRAPRTSPRCPSSCRRSRRSTAWTRGRRWSGCGSTGPTSGPTRPRSARLLPVEIGELNRLYQLGFASWLPASAIADGVYYGDPRRRQARRRPPGRTSISPQARLAVVGNVLTHADYRGRGYATAVTGAVTAELLRTLRPGRPQRPVRQPARAPGLPPARLRRARPVRGAARSIVSARRGRTSAPLRRLFARKETDRR